MAALIKARIRLRGDTAENWTSVNPMLKARELGVELEQADGPDGTTWHKAKLGPGTWNDLPYISIGDADAMIGVLAHKVGTDLLSSTAQPNMIPLADGDGKIDASWLPALSFNDLTDQPDITQFGVDNDPTMAANSNGVVPTQRAVRTFANALVEGVSWKKSVRMASTGNLTLSGVQDIDGITGAAGDRVLVMNQTTIADNGLYDMKVGPWSRCADASTGDEILWAAVFVRSGTTKGNRRYVNNNTGTITLGVTGIQFTIMDIANGYTADESTLKLVGNQFSVKDAELLALAGLTSAANKIPYFTGPGTADVADFTTMGKTLAGTASAMTARASLQVDELQTFSNANVSVTKRVVLQVGTMTAQRVVTLPLANTVNSGAALYIGDASGSVGVGGSLKIGRAGSDTLNGGSVSLTLSTPYGGAWFFSNGSNAWTTSPGQLQDLSDTGLFSTMGITDLARNLLRTETGTGMKNKLWAPFAGSLPKSASYTALVTDAGMVIEMTTGSTNRVITLPDLTAEAGGGEGWAIVIRKTDSGTGTVTTNPATSTLSKQGEAMIVVRTNSTWEPFVFDRSPGYSANVQSLLGAADFATVRTLLSLDPEFKAITTADFPTGSTSMVSVTPPSGPALEIPIGVGELIEFRVLMWFTVDNTACRCTPTIVAPSGCAVQAWVFKAYDASAHVSNQWPQVASNDYLVSPAAQVQANTPMPIIFHGFALAGATAGVLSVQVKVNSNNATIKAKSMLLGWKRA